MLSALDRQIHTPTVVQWMEPLLGVYLIFLRR